MLEKNPAREIPTQEMFTFHKLFTFVNRENKDKIRKDLYYAYYILRFCPDVEKLIGEIKVFLLERPEGQKVRDNLRIYFKDYDSKGCVLIEQENGPDDFVSNVRKDVFNRFHVFMIS